MNKSNLQENIAESDAILKALDYSKPGWQRWVKTRALTYIFLIVMCPAVQK